MAASTSSLSLHKSPYPTHTTRRLSIQDPALEPGRHHQDRQFWDSLSRVHLTLGALRELNRRSRVERQQAKVQSESTDPACPQNSVNNSLLQRFARSGGPDLTDLRGFQTRAESSQTMPSSRSSSSRVTMRTSKKSHPYSANFEQKLIDVNVFPYGGDRSIENWDEIHDRLARSRPSLTSSQFGDDDFRQFQRAAIQANLSEAKVVQNAIAPFILGNKQVYPSQADIQFSHLRPFDDSLSAPKPDLYDGMSPRRIPVQVREDIGHLIIPSTVTSRPVAPNFFSEWKSQRGRADVAQLQACYDGAAGARAVHALQNYGKSQPQYDNKANSFSSIFHNGQLQMYATHMTAPVADDDQPSYYMTPLRSFAMTDNARTFREGAAAYRNARDYAAEIREAAVDEAAAGLDTCHGRRSKK